MGITGKIYGINGPVITIQGNPGYKMNEMVYVGEHRLVGEVIRLSKEKTTIQVYEETSGLKPGEEVAGAGCAISVKLAPGILNNIFDGIERPLQKIAEKSGAFIPTGAQADALDREKLWETHITVQEGDEVIKKTVQAQVGRATSKGFDFDITLHPVTNLQIVGGLGWSDYRQIASNMDWIPQDADWVTLDEDGKINIRATGVPRTTFYTYADYTIPRGILKDFSFHLSGTFTDRIYSSIENNVYDPSRYIVDAGIYYTIKNSITLSCNINNIFNNHYFSSATKLAKPRNFIATIAYNF